MAGFTENQAEKSQKKNRRSLLWNHLSNRPAVQKLAMQKLLVAIHWYSVCNIWISYSIFKRHVLFFSIQQQSSQTKKKELHKSTSEFKWIFCGIFWENDLKHFFIFFYFPWINFYLYNNTMLFASIWSNCLAQRFISPKFPTPMIQTAEGEKLMRSIVDWVGLKSVHVSYVHTSPCASSFLWPLKLQLLNQA